jgi:hypothetical protein
MKGLPIAVKFGYCMRVDAYRTPYPPLDQGLRVGAIFSLIPREEQHVQMKTRVVGVLATSACAIGMMGAPAFASVYHSYNGSYNHSYNHSYSSVKNTYNRLSNVGNTSILSGNTVDIPVSIPIDVCGNAIAILGFAEASCQGGAGVFQNSPNSGW